MFLPLDLVSTTVIIAVIHLMLGFLLLVFWSSSARGTGFGWWVGNEAVLALGIGLLVLSPALPMGAVLLVSNLCFFAAMPMIETGLRRWFGRPMDGALRLRWAVAVLAYLAWASAYLGGLEYATRAVIFSCATVLQGALFLSYLLSVREPGVQLPLRILFVGIAVVMLFSVLRVVHTWPHVGMPSQPDPSVLSSLLVTEVVAAIIRVCAMLLLLHGRVERGLRQAQRALERQAQTDALTQVASRAHFESQCRVRLAEAGQRQAPACLMVCDMDGFKALNDQLGHPAGDAMLAQFAEQLRRTIRRHDLAGRLGGDEFAVLFTDCTLDEARDIAERLCLRVKSLTVADQGRVSLSAGLVPVEPGVDFEQAYAQADQALYAAKAAGRDRVVAVTPA